MSAIPEAAEAQPDEKKGEFVTFPDSPFELFMPYPPAGDQPAHAVLDVFQTEPLPADSWFWDHPKVRVSAHTSNSGDGNAARGDELFLENLRRYLAKEPLLNEAHPSEVGL